MLFLQKFGHAPQIASFLHQLSVHLTLGAISEIVMYGKDVIIFEFFQWIGQLLKVYYVSRSVQIVKLELVMFTEGYFEFITILIHFV